jgi:hypothetical protein
MFVHQDTYIFDIFLIDNKMAVTEPARAETVNTKRKHNYPFHFLPVILK